MRPDLNPFVGNKIRQGSRLKCISCLGGFVVYAEEVVPFSEAVVSPGQEPLIIVFVITLKRAFVMLVKQDIPCFCSKACFCLAQSDQPKNKETT